MSNAKQRYKNRATDIKLKVMIMHGLRECKNCKELTASGHYMPPSLGDKGGFICRGEQ